MDKKIIIVIVSLVAIAISGCINSPIDNINLIIPKLSQNIVDGDINYNEAVKYVNARNYDAADQKVKESTMNFNEGQNKLLSIDNLNELNNTIHIQYINLISEELSLKQNATINLQLAIQYFKSGDNKTANEHVTKANSLMTQGVSFQNQRQSLVVNNPNIFKEK
jgi:cellobiose-specific phosphotransferase system component IIA